MKAKQKTKEKKMSFRERQEAIFQEVTDRILEQLDKGVVPWRKPWKGLRGANPNEMAVSYEKQTAYSLLNQILLGESGEYLTFAVIKKYGGTIRKGERSRLIVFSDTLVKEDPDHLDEDGNPKVLCIPYLKHYRVWNLNQVDGIPSRRKTPEAGGDKKPEPKVRSQDAAEAIVDGYLAQPSHPKLIVRPSSEAYYQPSTDTVVVPRLEQYDDPAEYYSTLFHELIHSTGHKDRLARKGVTAIDGFGSEQYSKEELIAEMGAAMLVADAGLNADKACKNSIGYIQGWGKKLRDDPKIFVWAASGAEKAAKWVLGIKTAEATETEEETTAAAA